MPTPELRSAEEWASEVLENLVGDNEESVARVVDAMRAYAAQECAALQAALTELPTWGAYTWQEAAASVKLKLKENSAQIVQLIHERDALQRRVEALEAPLRELWALIEEGYLVRNTTNDGHFPSYMAESVRLVTALKEAEAALRGGRTG